MTVPSRSGAAAWKVAVRPALMVNAAAIVILFINAHKTRPVTLFVAHVTNSPVPKQMFSMERLRSSGLASPLRSTSLPAIGGTIIPTVAIRAMRSGTSFGGLSGAMSASSTGTTVGIEAARARRPQEGGRCGAKR
eukprot:688779-Prymnesium_polylepis.1